MCQDAINNSDKKMFGRDIVKYWRAESNNFPLHRTVCQYTKQKTLMFISPFILYLSKFIFILQRNKPNEEYVLFHFYSYTRSIQKDLLSKIFTNYVRLYCIF
jgi:hypothetical protein